jgi:hypothetical protein
MLGDGVLGGGANVQAVRPSVRIAVTATVGAILMS